ncbi:reverse transcriptase domain-containing protein [Tanacetum coccineum]
MIKRSDEVRSHHQNSEEAGMLKDISGSELLALSLCSAQAANVNLPQHLASSVGPGIPIYPKKKTKEGMVDSQPMEEEFWGAVTRDVQAKMKATPRKLAYVDSDKEAPSGSSTRGFSYRFSLESSNTYETHKQNRSASKSQRTPSKNKEPTHLRRSRRLEDRSITKEKARRERSKPKGKRSRHQETSLDSKREEGSEDAYEYLNSPYKRPKPTPFTEIITQFKYHNRAKLPQNIRVYEGNKDPKDHLGIFSTTAEQEEWPMPVWCKMFCQTLGGATRNWFDDLDPKSMDSFEELSQKFLEDFSQQKRYAKDPTEIHGIKRRQNEGLQAFMDQFKSKTKKLNDKIPKTVDEMFERVRAFIRGEVVPGSAEMVRLSQGEKGQRSQHQRLLSIKKANRGNCGLEEVGSSGEGHSPEQPAEWKLGKERCKDHKHDKRPQYQYKVKTQKMQSSDGRFFGRNISSSRVIDLRVTMGRARRSKTVLMEFAIIKCHSLYNVIIGRTRMRSLRAVGSTIHSMIKFPTNQGIVTMETSKETLWECKQQKRVQGSWKEVQWHQREEQMSRKREQVILRTKNSSERGPNSGLVSLEKT